MILFRSWPTFASMSAGRPKQRICEKCVWMTLASIIACSAPVFYRQPRTLKYKSQPYQTQVFDVSAQPSTAPDHRQRVARSSRSGKVEVAARVRTQSRAPLRMVHRTQRPWAMSAGRLRAGSELLCEDGCPRRAGCRASAPANPERCVVDWPVRLIAVIEMHTNLLSALEQVANEPEKHVDV
jgi:hypothetical protein